MRFTNGGRTPARDRTADRFESRAWGAPMDTAGAAQILYACADRADDAGRAIVFRLIAHLTGYSVARIVRTWQATR